MEDIFSKLKNKYFNNKLPDISVNTSLGSPISLLPDIKVNPKTIMDVGKRNISESLRKTQEVFEIQNKIMKQGTGSISPVRPRD